MNERHVYLQNGAVAYLETVKTQDTCSGCHRSMQVGETYWEIAERKGFKSVCVLCFHEPKEVPSD